ncbi:MAG: TIGR03960 family B12-binding radical SAM protein [Desulfobacteraceae bacterium]|nr:TIGR03960 family B12-binding radical SAM protein [Desulfobacteraceae bacterium]
MLWKIKQRQQKWLEQEKGTVLKDWGAKTRIALAFPNRYAVGMSNLGFHYVYEALNRFDGVACERVFYPEPEDMRLIRKTPGSLLSVESQKPLLDFHLVAFSVPYENDYVNVLQMLDMAGIPARGENRTSAHPLVCGGGVALFLNPEPLAPFLDFIFAGEAESLLPDFISFWNEFVHEDIPRPELLSRLGRSISGIYVPSCYRPEYDSDGALKTILPVAGSGVPERVAARRAELDKSEPCRTAILTPNTEFSNVLLLEIGRGCGRGCRFCAAGFVYRPARYHDADRLLSAAEDSRPDTDRIGLVSAAVSDHPAIHHLCDAFIERGNSLSFSSLRADTLTPEMLSALEASDHQAVAIAPEAGSERLRRVINKNLTEEQIYRASEILAQKGILNIKLYFMIGLPTETIEDLQAIVDLAKGIRHHVLAISRGNKRFGNITLSVNSFVPKPFTPFQWVPFAGVRELKDKAKWIQTALRKVPNVRVHFDLPKWAYVQALLARGDRRVSRFLEMVALNGLSWGEAMRDAELNSDFWIMRERGRDEKFPWEVIEHGISRRYLWEELQRAFETKSSPECPRDRNCRRCGVCRPADETGA